MKKIIVCILLLLASGACLPQQVCAEDDAVKNIFLDGFYGGMAGALVGTAFTAFTKHPGDHLDNIAIGGGIGILAGTAYGVVRSTRAMAEIERGKMTVQFPSVQLRMDRSPVNLPPTGSLAPFWSADVLRLHF